MRDTTAAAESRPARRPPWRWLVGDRSKLLLASLEPGHRTRGRVPAPTAPARSIDFAANPGPPAQSRSLYHRRSDESAAAAANSKSPAIAAIYRDCSRVWLLMAEYNENCVSPREPAAKPLRTFAGNDQADARISTTAELDDILVAVREAMN